MTNDPTSPARSPLLQVFVATDETQGTRKNDFCFATVGELVRFATECDGETVDGPCGCRRAVSGMVSLRATTTFKVAVLPMSVQELVDALEHSYQASGWAAFLNRDDALAEARDLLEMADGFPVGAVLERRGNKIQCR